MCHSVWLYVWSNWCAETWFLFPFVSIFWQLTIGDQSSSRGDPNQTRTGPCLTHIQLPFVSKSEVKTNKNNIWVFCQFPVVPNFKPPFTHSPPTHVTSSKNGIEQQWSSWIWDLLSHPQKSITLWIRMLRTRNDFGFYSIIRL